MTDKIVVFTTCETLADAERISKSLVELRLAACVNILPGVSSVYRWQHKIEQNQELLLVVKTRRGLFDKLRAHLESIHPYEVPEVVAIGVVDGAEGYLNWMDKELLPDE